MGNKSAAPATESKIFVITHKTYMNVELQRDKKIEELQRKENELARLISTSNQINQTDINARCVSVINLLKQIQASNLILGHLLFLKEKVKELVEAQKNKNQIEQYRGYIQTIIWSTRILNTTHLEDFTGLISNHFGSSFVKQAEMGLFVDISVG